MNKEIRRQVFERAKSRCECGCGRSITEETGQLDHVFGRAKAEETVANCMALTSVCHSLKTASDPSAQYWLQRFVTHSARHADEAMKRGDTFATIAYFKALDRAVTKLAVLEQKFHGPNSGPQKAPASQTPSAGGQPSGIDKER